MKLFLWSDTAVLPRGKRFSGLLRKCHTAHLAPEQRVTEDGLWRSKCVVPRMVIRHATEAYDIRLGRGLVRQFHSYLSSCVVGWYMFLCVLVVVT